MLNEAFSLIYSKFRLHFYRMVFSGWQKREASLSTVETFCMEVIHAMRAPTINEFSKLVDISSPNAAYKINSLIQKGYLEKRQSEEDKREYRLYPTRKYIDYYEVSERYVDEVVKRIEQHFSPEDVEKLESMIRIIAVELMPEIKLSNENINVN